jgi:hypothetical protein
MTGNLGGGGSGQAGRKMIGREIKSGTRLVFNDFFVGYSRTRLDTRRTETTGTIVAGTLQRGECLDLPDSMIGKKMVGKKNAAVFGCTRDEFASRDGLMVFSQLDTV